jgi:DNA polymerase-4
MSASADEANQALDVLHVDMDCFFAAVEVLDDPSLAGRPVVVGGTGPRGVVASCSYEARASGVHSAMPMSEARRRVPGAAFISGRHDRYGEVSRRLHEVFLEFTPVIEPIAFDEAFLDVSGSHAIFGPSREIAWKVRARVRDVLSLDCSVGVARSKLIAKLASRAAKPRATPAGTVPGPGVVLVTVEEETAFLRPRPVRDLWGVGPKTAERLARYGIHTVGDAADLDLVTAERILGRAAGRQLHALARGDDGRSVEADRQVKSVGHEETFSRDLHDLEPLHLEVVRLSDSVGSRLRAAKVVGRTVNLKVRFGDFRTVTRAHSLGRPLESSSEIAAIASALLEGVDVATGVRLIGVSVSSLEPEGSASGHQLSLLGLADTLGRPATASGARQAAAPAAGRRGDVERAVDAIRRRYGQQSVGPAALVSREGIRTKQLGDTAWGPARSPGDGAPVDEKMPGA